MSEQSDKLTTERRAMVCEACRSKGEVEVEVELLPVTADDTDTLAYAAGTDPRDAEALAMGLGDLRTWLGCA